jgi:hypothetical protein
VSVVLTGSPIPESGGAVGNLVAYHRANGLTVPRSLALASGRLVGEPVRDLPGARAYLEAHELRGLAVTALLCLGMVLAGVVWARSGRRRPGTSTLPLLALGVHGTAVLLFYGVVNAAPWFYDRYLLPAVAVLTLVAATAVGGLCRRAQGRRGARPAPERVLARPLAVAGLVAAAAVVLVGVVGTAGLFRLHPQGSVDAGYDGAKGYAEVSRQILGATPRGAVLGSLQTGALSYFSQVDDTGVHVVNLDGVVDKGAADALAGHRLAAYAEQRGMTHFADWPFNVGVFQQRSDAPGTPTPTLTPVTTAKRQGIDQFVLFQVTWPAS